ncbi:MAG: glutathione-disulfide reductase [Pseudomonadaceae bacterium]|nr:glutathione-disulfide reductase [Pseudomonadaceae bacterium]
MSYDFDLFVIGAGSGGVRASRMAASFGARVAVAESTYLGGTCVNVGCVPKKLFVYGSHFAHDVEDSAAYGWDAQVNDFDWPTLRDNKSREIERLNGIYRTLLDNAGVTLFEGRAVLLDAHTLEIDGRQVTAERILVATGSRPSRPDFPGSEHVIVSDDAFYLPEFPKRVMVLGGGYIAVEFAGIFKGLGAEVDLIYRGDVPLRGFDLGIRKFVLDEIRKQGIRVHLNTVVESLEHSDDGDSVKLSNGETLDVDFVMAAIGRRPNTENLGLEAAGVKLSEGNAVIVDDAFQTSVPGIYAIGDVIDRFQLTPVAIAEAMVLTANLYNGESRTMDYDNIATAVFCQPNIGTCGLTEEEAAARYEIDVFESTFKPMKHTLTGRDEKTMMKLIVRRSDDRVVGIHMAGPDAGEIIQGMAVAMQSGATKAHFDRTIGIHPTAAEEFVTMREKRA